jgi:hypothetical protein
LFGSTMARGAAVDALNAWREPRVKITNRRCYGAAAIYLLTSLRAPEQ